MHASSAHTPHPTPNSPHAPTHNAHLNVKQNQAAVSHPSPNCKPSQHTPIKSIPRSTLISETQPKPQLHSDVHTPRSLQDLTRLSTRPRNFKSNLHLTWNASLAFQARLQDQLNYQLDYQSQHAAHPSPKPQRHTPHSTNLQLTSNSKFNVSH